MGSVQSLDGWERREGRRWACRLFVYLSPLILQDLSHRYRSLEDILCLVNYILILPNMVNIMSLNFWI